MTPPCCNVSPPVSFSKADYMSTCIYTQTQTHLTVLFHSTTQLYLHCSPGGVKVQNLYLTHYKTLFIYVLFVYFHCLESNPSQGHMQQKSIIIKFVFC